MRLLYVHVGKTGGDSVSSFLKGSCAVHLSTDWHRPPPHWPPLGADAKGTAASCVGREVHMRRVAPFELATDVLVVISVRDPIARTVSAFNYNHPSGAMWRKRPDVRNDPLLKQLYSCYNTTDQFARGLTREDACAVVARAAFNQSTACATCHIAKGLDYYMGDALRSRQEQQQAQAHARGWSLVHVDSIEADLRCTFKRFDRPWPNGTAGVVPHINSFVPLTSSHREPPTNELSDEAQRNLKAALASEFAMLATLEAGNVCAGHEHRGSKRVQGEEKAELVL